MGAVATGTSDVKLLLCFPAGREGGDDVDSRPVFSEEGEEALMTSRRASKRQKVREYEKHKRTSGEHELKGKIGAIGRVNSTRFLTFSMRQVATTRGDLVRYNFGD